MIIFNALQTSLSGGIGRYCYELSKAIYNLKEINFKIVIREEDKKLFDFANENDLIIITGIKNSKQRNYYEQFILPKQIYKKYPKAVLHYPDTMAPLIAKNKVIITVHDLAFKSLKGAFTWKASFWKNIITDFSVKKADKIVSITNFTKNELLKYYPKISQSKIEVIYNGFNDFSKEEINYDNVEMSILNLKSVNYILTVSTISPRKNVDGLIRAFKLIKDKIDCNLVITGNNGWLYEKVYKLVDELELDDRVIFTGGVNDDELKFLYKNTKLFVYPSFYEGFGLPPLEAMSFGVPCVVSNTTAMPEVVGDFATLVNPNDINDIALKMVTVLKSENKVIEESNKFIDTNFSWTNCANRLLCLYNSLF